MQVLFQCCFSKSRKLNAKIVTIIKYLNNEAKNVLLVCACLCQVGKKRKNWRLVEETDEQTFYDVIFKFREFKFNFLAL